MLNIDLKHLNFGLKIYLFASRTSSQGRVGPEMMRSTKKRSPKPRDRPPDVPDRTKAVSPRGTARPREEIDPSERLGQQRREVNNN